MSNAELVVDTTPLYFFLLARFDRLNQDAPRGLVREMLSRISPDRLAEVEARLGSSTLLTTPSVVSEVDRRIRNERPRKPVAYQAPSIVKALRDALLDLYLTLTISEHLIVVRDLEPKRYEFREFGPTDAALIHLAEREKACLITGDRALSRRCAAFGVPAIYILAAE